MSCVHAREICFILFALPLVHPWIKKKNTFLRLRGRHPPSRPGCALQPRSSPALFRRIPPQWLGGKLIRAGSSPPLPRMAFFNLFLIYFFFPFAFQLSRGAPARGEPAGASAPSAGPRFCPAGRARSFRVRAARPRPRTMARGRGSRPATGAGRRVLSGGQGFPLSPFSPRPASQQKAIFLNNHQP